MAAARRLGRAPAARRSPRSAQRGHAIEARIYSEDPRRGFLPSVGRVRRFAHPPQDDAWRVDAGIADGDVISVHYDPMIAKVIAFGADRDAALATLRHRLDRTAVFGVANNLPLLRAIAAHPAFAAGDVDTGFVDRELAALTADAPPAPEARAARGEPCARRARAAGRRGALALGAQRTAGARRARATQSVGLRTPAFRRWRATARGDAIELASDGASIRGRVAVSRRRDDSRSTRAAARASSS